MANCIMCDAPLQPGAARCDVCGLAVSPSLVQERPVRVEPRETEIRRRATDEMEQRPVSGPITHPAGQGGNPNPGSPLGAVSGVVITSSSIAEPRRGGCAGGVIALLACALLALYAIASADQLIAAAMPLVVVLALVWIAASALGIQGLLAGIGRVFGRVFVGGATIAAGTAIGSRVGRGANAALIFGLQPIEMRTDRRLDVHFVGRGDGVEIGDRVSVFGPRIFGRVEAILIRNYTNGQLMLRAGTIMSAVNIIVICILLWALASASGAADFGSGS